mmetsp:Transcript_14876/g.25230  ORF Transcript_14876/g.25230 Transcript_14876/m.25230 type:complete len:82 (+) Transcript_14876:520-765(+)
MPVSCAAKSQWTVSLFPVATKFVVKSVGSWLGNVRFVRSIVPCFAFFVSKRRELEQETTNNSNNNTNNYKRQHIYSRQHRK